MFAAAHLYQHKELVVETLNFTDNHALEVLQSDAFLSLSPVSHIELLHLYMFNYTLNAII